MMFWKLVFDMGWIDRDKEIAAQKLRLAVKTESNPLGEITTSEYKQITGKEFDAAA
ncbi:XkdX family protein [Cytobacillus praedii]|uniref:XkdX family protein n=1 Tax=Cytobacillus praedii TaxID=1742358 RepID=A0A4R1AUS7_9BACI|nr:XkdX family protein [Cytobacillus praedii]TCJ04083.1 XkdX family protein [Cytobacillus praedii]